MGLLEERLGYASPSTNKKEKEVKTLYQTDHPEFETSTTASDDDEDIVSRLNKNNNNKKKPTVDEDDFAQQMFGGNGLDAKREKPLQSAVVLGSSDETEEDFFINSLDQARKEEEAVRKHKKRKRILNFVMVAACVYVIFLIYGVFCTSFQYNEKGEITPVVLSVSEIKALKNYNTILVQYEDCRVLYEKILQLDYRLGLGVEDPMTLAPEYEKLLDEVNDLTVKTDALDVDMRYATIKNMLLNFVKTDTAVYLQKISSGISQNNGDDAAVAIEYKNLMYDDFSLITQNMITVGENIKGANVNGVKKWSPEGYIDEFINGKHSEDNGQPTTEEE